MKLNYPKSENAKTNFLEQFLIGARVPENLGLVTSSLITDMELTQTAYETARATKNQHLGRRIELVAEREAAMGRLKLLITQTVSNLKLQIRKGIYPKTVLPNFGIPMNGYTQPSRYEDILRTGKQFIEGDTYLTSKGYPRLNSPRATELQTEIDRLVSLEEELTASKNSLSQARDALKLEGTTVTRIHRRGSKELDITGLEKTKEATRDLKRNFGYKYTATTKPEGEEDGDTTDNPGTDGANQEDTSQTEA